MHSAMCRQFNPCKRAVYHQDLTVCLSQQYIRPPTVDLKSLWIMAMQYQTYSNLQGRWGHGHQSEGNDTPAHNFVACFLHVLLHSANCVCFFFLITTISVMGILNNVSVYSGFFVGLINNWVHLQWRSYRINISCWWNINQIFSLQKDWQSCILLCKLTTRFVDWT